MFAVLTTAPQRAISLLRKRSASSGEPLCRAFGLNATDERRLLGGSDAVFQQRNRELAIVEGELSKLDQELNQAKFHLLQLESTVARLRTDCSGYEVDQKTSLHKHDSVAQELDGVRAQKSSAEQIAAETDARAQEAVAGKSRAHGEAATAQQTITDLTREFREAQLTCTPI